MVYEIDGANFSTLEEFFEEVSRALNLSPWGHNLDAFNDILRGGFGTPDAGFTLRWKNHEKSKVRLGYSETVRQLQLRLQKCHPENRATGLRYLSEAERNEGPTVFDWLVEIIRRHGKGGDESKDAVDLLLE
jgi:RNAse (barnase) inhibitor barstar